MDSIENSFSPQVYYGTCIHVAIHLVDSFARMASEAGPVSVTIWTRCAGMHMQMGYVVSGRRKKCLFFLEIFMLFA